MPKRRSLKLVGVSINLPDILVKALDALAKEVETTRTDVIEDILNYGLENVDDVFPLDEDEEDEEGAPEEEEEEEATTHDPKKPTYRNRKGGGQY